jgi:hypothetical protein
MPPFFTEEGNRFGADLKSISFYCTFTALNCKCLIINGAGEGNRTLVSGLGSPHSTIEPHPLLSPEFIPPILIGKPHSCIGRLNLTPFLLEVPLKRDIV